MATEFLRMALIRLDDQQNQEAIYYFQQTQYHATEAIHTCINFQGLLKSIRMRLVSSAFIESAVEIDGKYFKAFQFNKAHFTSYFRPSLFHSTALSS